MTTLDEARELVETFRIRSVHANLDTLNLFSDKLTPGFRTTLDRLMQRRVKIVPMRPRGAWIVMKQPRLPALRWLVEVEQESRLKINRADIGPDMATDRQEHADGLRSELKRTVRLKNASWRSPAEPDPDWGYVVWNKSRWTKNAVAYSRREIPARISGEPYYCRLELRFRKDAARRRFSSIASLLEINPRELFKREMRFHPHTEEEYEQALERYAQRQMQRNRKRMMERKREHDLADALRHKLWAKASAKREGIIVTKRRSDALFDLFPTELSFDYHK